ncbi:MAG: lysophospholipase [Clostridiales bacterium]|nr:lysophospholipase [Clostridiales bacterium]
MAEFMTMRDGKKVAVTYWEEVSSPRGAVVLVHGMCEYIARYDDFARYLNVNGYYVIGMDNRSFGDTDPEELGRGYVGMFEDTVDDIKQLVDEAKGRWNPDKVFVIGHSYGSFLTQRFIEKYNKDVDGAILSGSALQDGFILKMGSKIANGKFKKDPAAPGEIFAKLTFKSYDKKLSCSTNGWLNRDRAAVEKYNADPRCNFICSVGFYKSMFDGLKVTNKERKLVPSSFKLMIASGTADGVGGYGKLVKKLAKSYRKKCGLDPRVKMYEDGRHEILNELNKGVVYEDFVKFLDEASEK